MAITIHFRNEVCAKQAKNDCFLLGYWGFTRLSDSKGFQHWVLICHEDCEGTIRLRFGDDIID